MHEMVIQNIVKRLPKNKLPILTDNRRTEFLRNCDPSLGNQTDVGKDVFKGDSAQLLRCVVSKILRLSSLFVLKLLNILQC